MLHSSYNIVKCCIPFTGLLGYSRDSLVNSNAVCSITIGARVNNSVNNFPKSASTTQFGLYPLFDINQNSVVNIDFYSKYEYLPHLIVQKYSIYTSTYYGQNGEHVQNGEQNKLFTSKKKPRSPPGPNLFNS